MWKLLNTVSWSKSDSRFNKDGTENFFICWNITAPETVIVRKSRKMYLQFRNMHLFRSQTQSETYSVLFLSTSVTANHRFTQRSYRNLWKVFGNNLFIKHVFLRELSKCNLCSEVVGESHKCKDTKPSRVCSTLKARFYTTGGGQVHRPKLSELAGMVKRLIRRQTGNTLFGLIWGTMFHLCL